MPSGSTCGDCSSSRMAFWSVVAGPRASWSMIILRLDCAATVRLARTTKHNNTRVRTEAAPGLGFGTWRCNTTPARRKAGMWRFGRVRTSNLTIGVTNELTPVLLLAAGPAENRRVISCRGCSGGSVLRADRAPADPPSRAALAGTGKRRRIRPADRVYFQPERAAEGTQPGGR